MLANLDHILENSQKINKIRNCIYFLIKNDQIVYVGQCGNGLARISDHLCDDSKEFDCYTTIQCDKEEISELEAEYIVKFNPELNKMLPQNKKYKLLSRIMEELFIDCDLFNEVISRFKPEPVFKNYYDINTIESLFWRDIPGLERALHIELERYRIKGKRRAESNLNHKRATVNVGFPYINIQKRQLTKAEKYPVYNYRLV